MKVSVVSSQHTMLAHTETSDGKQWLAEMGRGVCAVFFLGSNRFKQILSVAVLFSTPWVTIDAAPVDFARDIQRILADRCLTCHGPDGREAGLRLNDPSSAFSRLRSGNQAIVPGDAEASELIRRIISTDRDVRMPPEGPALSDEQVALLRRWIEEGAPYSLHWAYRPISQVVLPPVRQLDWAQNPIDHFVLAQLEQNDIQPSPEADRATLIKRLHYDLIGLPPTIHDVDTFLTDHSPHAYESLVERLLASPHFGERWGRHWLDKARYADSDGYEKDNVRPDAHHFRDWVIDAINQDLAFDRFSEEQLAGDLLPDATDRTRLATAFHRQTLTNKEGGIDKEQFRVAAVVDRVNTTGSVWLGLTVGCAQCHTHKYDAISHSEYFGLYAFFNNAEETESPLNAFDTGKTSVPVRFLIEREERRPSHRHVKGDFLNPAEEVPPHTPSVLHPLERRQADNAPDRLDLARWLFDSRNTLTPRVAVNDLWMHLFGRGLVSTVDDFGVRGDPPTHPELLDWLATEYRGLGWSRKAMIRRIVISATYRQSSIERLDLVERDPLNNHLARQNRFRVEAEIVRDLTLAVSGMLSDPIGGPSVFPPMPPEIAALSYANNFKWKPSDGADRFRRGMYTFFKRTAPHPNLTVFDCPDANTSLLQRQISNTPLQALTSLNNEMFVEAARALARRSFLEAPSLSDQERLLQTMRWCVVRSPDADEVSRLYQLLSTARQYYAGDNKDAELLAGNDVGWPDAVSVQERAAWIATVRIVLNLDEFLTRQ